LDAAGRPHIGYYCCGTDLRYAFYDGTGWQIRVVDAIWDVGEWNSLVLDMAGQPHISYHDSGYPTSTLKYAHLDGWRWYTETVDSSQVWQHVGWWNSLALDAQGWPHISYCVGARSSDRGASWTMAGAVNQPSDDSDLRYAYLCALLDAANIQGPARLRPGETGVFTATYTPITATLPTLEWSNGVVDPTAAYSWTVPGRYTITITATNGCSVVSATLPVEVRPCRRFIPMMPKPNFIP
jgi:hypothetical protein